MKASAGGLTKCLITAATALEIAPLTAKYPQAEVFITGVGVPDTLFKLQQKLSNEVYTLVIQAGICGSFTDTYKLGSTVMVQKDCFGDLGFSTAGRFTPIAASDFVDENDAPYRNGWLENPYLNNKAPLPQVKAVTVNQVTDNPDQIKQLVDHFKPDIESMEGAAFHYVCLSLGVPFLQIRSISNRVGERDKRKWEMKTAIANLNRALELISLPKDKIDMEEFKRL